MFRLPARGFRAASLLLLLAGILPARAAAQPTPPSVTLPPVIVTAQKEPREGQESPLSVTAVGRETIEKAGIRTVSEAGTYAPNTWFTEFTARKLSNARVRGIGSSPLNPAVTTYIDGVPQLNANTSNLELLDVEQIEFVRGPQSPLFGRNALGGIITVTSRRPSLSEWTGSLVAPLGNVGARELRGGLSGPIGSALALGVSLGRQVRDGYAINTRTGMDVDRRDAAFGKVQLLWVPSQNWEARLIVSGERDRDGDYSLADLDQVRRTPFALNRDFVGFTRRDIVSTVLGVRGEGERVAITTSTGVVAWKTHDRTDLDYSPVPAATRDNRERAVQFTQEVRLASPRAAPVQLSDSLALDWQAGAALFTQRYDQTAVNTVGPFALSPVIGFPLELFSPVADLNDVGIGVFGQGSLGVGQLWKLTVGLRFDHERKDAGLSTFYQPAILPAVRVEGARSYSNLSPQASVAYRAAPDVVAYASAAQGFKAGGFNPSAPAGGVSYDVERAWHFEGGVKTMLAGRRVMANAAVFFITWDDLQLDVPNLQAPGQFYVSNVGRARSRGVEVELTARPHPQLDLFASAGYTDAAFSRGSVSGGLDVSGNGVPNTPDYTATIGAQLTRPLSDSLTMYGRAEATVYGAFHYDDLNTRGQDAYSVASFRAGARRGLVFVEAWIENAFDTAYVPVAFPYLFAPSGFIGEPGRPRTFGLTAGVEF